MYAANVANLEMTRLLLDRGADASFAKNQYTVLMAACANRESEENVVKCVDLLLSRNANPNTLNRNLMTPLMYAAREGHTQTITLLVAHGAEINIKDEKSFTALTWAASQGHKSAVLKLIELGADKTLKTNCGETVADIASKNKHFQLAALLTVTSNSSLLGKMRNISKEEAIFKFFKNQSGSGKNCKVSFPSAFGDLDLFLCGLELEHLQEIFQDHDVSFKCLLTMGKEDMKKIGITDPSDQMKILDAICEMQPDDLQVSPLSAQNISECSSEELAKFLFQLTRHCSQLTASVQNATTQITTNSELRVLDLDSDQKSSLLASDLATCVAKLEKEVGRFSKVLLKLQDDQESVPSRIPLSQEYFGRSSQLMKKLTIVLFGTGLVFLLGKLHLRNVTL
ncbi:ankyrin repeat, SAM and basic leucine zipper domain-containing protein 1 isoform X2 [Callorhinchus milii]|nr:ankyrin repeat, SAM and basic leucine zipper domain-containing protein 1 isoform X2 [Callorhinchus milii]